MRQIGIVVRGVKKRYLSEVNLRQQLRKRGKGVVEDSSFGADHPHDLVKLSYGSLHHYECCGFGVS